MEEILTFCSRYLDNIETRWNRTHRVDDEPNDIQPNKRIAELFPLVGKAIGGSSYFRLTSIERLQAHQHVLTNCPLIDQYLLQYREIVRKQLRRRTRNANDIDKKVHREFIGWFSTHIFEIVNNLNEADKTILLCLAEVQETIVKTTNPTSEQVENLEKSIIDFGGTTVLVEEPHHKPLDESDSSTIEIDQCLATDPAKIFSVEEKGGLPKDNLERPIGLKEDPHALGSRLEAYIPSNDQIKVTDPCGGGELDTVDGMIPLDTVVRILNNQLTSLMWIDEKAEEFSFHIQKLANQGSASDRELTGPGIWMS
ncbi:hypothetical protein VNO77_07990 [Canavalia gladiata]|uniref:LTI65/LTI78 NYQTKV repeat domain-containing protein n=1 Tax=Canavalia gladiata TaxID=3824 RepID=A0AAN9MDQ6_CANGL